MAGELRIGFGDGATIEAPPVVEGEKMFRVVVESGDEQELNYVAVSVNGSALQIMRGVEVVIPESYVKVLEEAKATRLVKDFDSNGREIKVYKNFNRYPYRVLGEVIPDKPLVAPVAPITDSLGLGLN